MLQMFYNSSSLTIFSHVEDTHMLYQTYY